MPRLGAALPLHNLPPAQQVAYLIQAEASGYESAWIPEVMGTDAFTVLAAAAPQTQRLRLGTGIVPLYTRTPTTLAMTAATLDALSGGRAILGLGVSSEVIISAWHGLPMPPPLRAMREGVEIIRRLLRNERVHVEGQVFRVHNLRANVPLPPERTVPIYLGALNPGMLRLAGEIADGVLLNWLPVSQVGRVLEAIASGAQRAGRRLADLDIACYIRTCVTDDPAAARQWLRRELTGYAIVDAYHAHFTACGFGAESSACRSAWQQGDRAGAMQCLSEPMLQAMAAVGSPEDCRASIDAFRQAGISLPVVFPFSPEAAPFPGLLHTMQSIAPD
ncbi:MAG: LLM class flavin-dependent oxidoreductase [Candidatus Tectimicrobiota bacterium]